jgi:subtilisin family serine protease
VLAASLSQGASHPVGVGALPDISSGLKVAIDLGAHVLNLSFGTAESDVDPHGPLPHADVVQYADAQGCTLVAASGNSGVAERYYPAALPQVIAVGSVDGTGARSHFSTYGDHLALSAPGEHIVSTGITGLREGSGTSYAAPFVTGAAALLVAHARRSGRRLSCADVRRLLVGSASPVPGGRSNETGAGLLDVAAALGALDAEAQA